MAQRKKIEFDHQLDLDNVEDYLNRNWTEYIDYTRDEDSLEIVSLEADATVEPDGIEIDYWDYALEPEEDLYSNLEIIVNLERARSLRER